MRAVIKKPSVKQAQKSFFKAFFGWAIVFVVLFVVAVKLVIAETISNPLLTAVILMPALPLIGGLFVFRKLLQVCDEMHKQTLMKALLQGLSAILIILIPWGFMDIIVPNMPRLRPAYLINLFVLVYSVSLVHGHWKSGAFSKTKDYDPWREPKA